MSFDDHVNQLIVEKGRAEDFSGAVLIQRGGETLFEAATGYAQRSWKVANRMDTRFRIASVSKLFTAVAVLQLVDQGKLTLDTPVRDVLELKTTSIPPQATVYHMLTMTSGMADWFDESGDWEVEWEALCREHPIYLLRRNQDYLPLFVHADPVAAVGETYQYNGAGYILLGLLIERVSGLSYFDYVCQHVFSAADMLRSGFVALDDVADGVAEGYIPIEDENETIIGWKRNIYSTTPEAAADGGATSTALDLVRFSSALREERLLSPALTQQMLTPHVLVEEEGSRGYTWKYGFANMFLLEKNGHLVRWGHTGEEDGVSCRLYHYPGRELDVVILGNQSWCAGDLGWQLHDLILEMIP